MTLQIYNTASRQKEDFTPQAPPKVTMYNCGPTVYDFFHIGNARNFVVVDTVRRYLAFRGYEVKFVQNFTDIDDKIINRSRERGEEWDKLAERFTREYFRMADALGIQRADVHPKATEHIPHMLDLVKKLEDRGLAYAQDGDVYFRVRQFDSYGALSGRNVDDLQEGARVEVADQKEDPLDFALWKSTKPGEPSWESPWGAGRPGWHLECSAMSMHHLGETIDIHSGGTDLVFPHHENERAQSTGATGKPFVRYWLHNGFVTRDNEKMSKSLGNFFTINEVLAKFSAASVRFCLLSAHYRHPIDYSDAALEEANSAVNRIREAVVTAEKIAGPGPADDSAGKAFEDAFIEVMDDDFNSQRAIGVVFEAVTELNEKRQAYARAPKGEVAAEIRGLAGRVRRLLDVLGLEKLTFAATDEPDSGLTDSLVDLLIRARALAKQSKQFAIADFIRDELTAMGIRLQDHPNGTIWLKD
jgi:cysteinyl-tRNA synthetase